MTRLERFHAPAERELDQAAQYYEAESPGLGFAFLMEVERCIGSIVEHPESGRLQVGTIRRRLVRRFPNALLYPIKPAGIRIVAVMNTRRRPMYRVGRDSMPSGKTAG